MLRADVVGAALPSPNAALPAESAPLIAKGLYWVNAPHELDEIPSCLAMSRRISDTVTFSMTWSRPRIVRELMTRPPVPEPGVPLEAFFA